MHSNIKKKLRWHMSIAATYQLWIVQSFLSFERTRIKSVFSFSCLLAHVVKLSQPVMFFVGVFQIADLFH